MKKLLAILLALTLLLSLAACAKTTPPATPETPVVEEPTQEPAIEEPAVDETPTPEETPAPEETPTEEVPEVSDSTLQPILDEMLTASENDFGGFFGSYPVSAEDAPYAIGYEGFTGKFDEALAYGPAIGSTAFIMVLFRLADGADAEAFAADIKSGANPAKWICVQADFVDAVANGQVVLFLMASSEACNETVRQAMLDAFAAADTTVTAA